MGNKQRDMLNLVRNAGIYGDVGHTGQNGDVVENSGKSVDIQRNKGLY